MTMIIIIITTTNTVIVHPNISELCELSIHIELPRTGGQNHDILTRSANTRFTDSTTLPYTAPGKTKNNGQKKSQSKRYIPC